MWIVLNNALFLLCLASSSFRQPELLRHVAPRCSNPDAKVQTCFVFNLNCGTASINLLQDLKVILG